MISKVHKINNEIVLAVCDKDLLGKKINENIIIKKSFYSGKEISEKELTKLVKTATIGNFFGIKTIKILKKHNLITEMGIIYIGKIPHAQIIKMRI